MPRPRKWRNVCALPKVTQFGPVDTVPDVEQTVHMTVDEYETIRLIDLEGMNQAACAAQMNIARTTVQGVYNVARRKLAESMVYGKTLLIEGGEYHICDGTYEKCGLGNCYRHHGGRGLQDGRGRGMGCGPHDGRGNGRGRGRMPLPNDESDDEP